MTEGNWDDGVPSWSGDGKWIYFCSNRTGHRELWKVPVAGGQPVQLTQNGAFEAKESKDGKWLYYSKFSGQGIWKMPILGGTETLVLNRKTERFWDLSDPGICFIDFAAKPHATINVYNFDTQRVTKIGSVEKEQVTLGGPWRYRLMVSGCCTPKSTTWRVISCWWRTLARWQQAM